MQTRCFTLTPNPNLGILDDGEMREFLSQCRLLDFREHPYIHEGRFFLACIAIYEKASSTGASTTESTKGPKPKTTGTPPQLDQQQNQTFEAIRNWRRLRAKKDGVPPYVILTNAQLCELVVRGASSATDLKAVAGIGDGKVDRYGDDLLSIMAKHSQTDGNCESQTSEMST